MYTVSWQSPRARYMRKCQGAVTATQGEFLQLKGSDQVPSSSKQHNLRTTNLLFEIKRGVECSRSFPEPDSAPRVGGRGRQHCMVNGPWCPGEKTKLKDALRSSCQPGTRSCLLPRNDLLTTAYLGGISPHLEISYYKGAHAGARHSTGAANGR